MLKHGHRIFLFCNSYFSINLEIFPFIYLSIYLNKVAVVWCIALYPSHSYSLHINFYTKLNCFCHLKAFIPKLEILHSKQYLKYINRYTHIHIHLQMYGLIYISNIHFICDMINAYSMGVKKKLPSLAILCKSSLVNTNTHMAHLLTSKLMHINSFQLQYALKKHTHPQTHTFHRNIFK